MGEGGICVLFLSKNVSALGAAKAIHNDRKCTEHRAEKRSAERPQQTACRWSEPQPLTAPAAPWHTGPQRGAAAPAGPSAAATALCRPLAPPGGEQAPAGFYLGCLESRSRSPPGTAASAVLAEAPRGCSHQR